MMRRLGLSGSTPAGRRAGAGLIGLLLWSSSGSAADEGWFADIERYTTLRETRLDVAGPEPASFTALGVAPFLTAQALASSDIAFSAAQVLDEHGNPRAAIGVDFAPIAVEDSRMTLGDYQHIHHDRFASRIQFSLAASKGESDEDRTTRIAPTMRIVFHEQRDPRVHRGPGSLKDCFERHISAPPEAQRQQQLALANRLRQIEAVLQAPATSEADRQAALQQRDTVQAQWSAGQAQYRAALQETVRQGMKSCRDDPEVATYTWNATGLTLGISPSFRDRADKLGSIEPKGLVTYATVAFGFDELGTRPTYVPSFFGEHAQILGQVLYRLNEPIPNPLEPKTYTDADELVASLRLRGGASPWSGNIEAAVIHDWFDNQKNDTFSKVSIGMDAHVAKGTWLSVSLGRTVWRDALPNEVSAGLSIKWSLLD